MNKNLSLKFKFTKNSHNGKVIVVSPSSPSWIINLFMRSQDQLLKTNKNTRTGKSYSSCKPQHYITWNIRPASDYSPPETTKRCTCIMISISMIEFWWESYLKFSFSFRLVSFGICGFIVVGKGQPTMRVRL